MISNWKSLAITMGAVLLAGGAAWMTSLDEEVSNAHLRSEDTATQNATAPETVGPKAGSSHTRESNLITDELETLTSSVSALTQQVQILAQEQRDAAADMRVTSARLDTLSAQFATMNSKLDRVLRALVHGCFT